MTIHHSGVLALTLLAAAACAHPKQETLHRSSQGASMPRIVNVIDSSVVAVTEASGVAAPVQQATMSTRLMGAVTAVFVHEGDRVRAGQLLLRLDTRDLEAKGAQARAGLAAAEAQAADAELQARRIRALYGDSAAPKAMLDAAETGLARAQAGLAAARGQVVEVGAVTGYGELRAPFAGMVIRRWVDPGAFAAPGAPLVTVQDAHQLRVTVTTTPSLARALRRGMPIEARIEDLPAPATVEGVAPVPGGGLYTVNALVGDPTGKYAAGGAASLLLPSGRRRAVLVPVTAIVRQGDLTGVRLAEDDGATLRWIRLGAMRGEYVEVLSGLRGGETVTLASGREE